MPAKFTFLPILTNIPYIDRLAVGLALHHDTGKYPDFLGHSGGFEQNAKASDSQLHKIHIALYQNDWTLRTWQKRSGYTRTCDNFVIYVRHFFFDDCFQIIDILTPDAHKTLDSRISHYIELAEQFHALNQQEMSVIDFYTSSHQISKTITLTR
ncbi:hypothetical protein E4T80_10995 [Muribacter muris]|uniref:Toxin YafO n=1 Tax=Muribacter muris TaxID=67855 RepID=A0A4Y9JTC5_9PAST|nr:type II toxin-antitoxin system YafO family toxin [Muribacter muris]MBF0785990.1 type II toxin-antitoxin system YafO family toxin [Muribacter muris]MBF0826073.1 type II toxin-antitoxin system YafO family toxin [Muribacter muris]TFV08179.1 hypothetical protein E4T80_10995 [Muribacter muris]